MIAISAGRPTYLLSSMKPVTNGSIDFTVPSSLSLATTISPPTFFVRFHEPWRAMKIWFLYCSGNMLRVKAQAERSGMWSEQRHRRLVIAARMTPAILRVGEIALMAEREAEMLLARGG